MMTGKAQLLISSYASVVVS